MNKLQLRDLAKRALWTFFQAGAGTFLTLAPGLLTAPNLSSARALGVSAMVASLGAGASAVKSFILTYRK